MNTKKLKIIAIIFCLWQIDSLTYIINYLVVLSLTRIFCLAFKSNKFNHTFRTVPVFKQNLSNSYSLTRT